VGGVIKLPATKRVLAAELGTSSETLSRTLARLRDQKLITVAAKTITVHEAAKLAAMLRHNLGET
jgi:CRP/FNR family transcriptional regulator